MEEYYFMAFTDHFYEKAHGFKVIQNYLTHQKTQVLSGFVNI